MSRSWKAPLYLLLFGLLTVYAVFFRNPNKITAPANLQTSSTGLELIVQPESGRAPLLDKINSAQKELLIEIYLFSDPQIITAVKEANGRGVAVKILLEKNPFGGGNLNQNTFADLQNSGVAIKWSNPTFALTHAKFMVIDRKVVWIMNQNLTAAAFKSNREYDVVDQNPEDMAEAVQIFTADWNRTGYTPVIKDLVVSPDNSRSKLEALINSATRSIDVEMEIFEDNEMINLLAASGKRVAVRVIAPDLTKVPSNKQDLDILKAAGVQVKTLSSPYIHAKLILIDGTRAYTGSVNLSTASLEQNRELGILVSQSDIISKLQETFEKDWEAGLVL